jgi:transposase-like protein
MKSAPVVHTDHPGPCPWCGQNRLRGTGPSADGNRWYRCGGCATTFYIHHTARMHARDEDRLVEGRS